MFEDKIIFGGLYRAKDLAEVWAHTSHPDLSMNDQRYNFWIPIKFSGNNFVAPGYYMIDTYQVSSFNSYHTSFEDTILPRLISFGEISKIKAILEGTPFKYQICVTGEAKLM